MESDVTEAVRVVRGVWPSVIRHMENTGGSDPPCHTLMNSIGQTAVASTPPVRREREESSIMLAHREPRARFFHQSMPSRRLTRNASGRHGQEGIVALHHAVDSPDRRLY